MLCSQLLPVESDRVLATLSQPTCASRPPLLRHRHRIRHRTVGVPLPEQHPVQRRVGGVALGRGVPRHDLRLRPRHRDVEQAQRLARVLDQPPHPRGVHGARADHVDADARADVYAAGVVLFELLTGAKPHEGESPIQVAYKHVHEDVPPPSRRVPGLPPYVDALVARATARDKDLRPTDDNPLAKPADEDDEEAGMNLQEQAGDPQTDSAAPKAVPSQNEPLMMRSTRPPWSTW